ncbi:MAG: AIR synthase-related protein, partial [Sulfobacillus sp.]
MAEPEVRAAPAELSVRRRLEGALGRAATDTEAAMVSVLWSEHCSYGHSKLALRQFSSQGSRVRVGPGENAGVVDIGQGYLLAAKIESHNHPSAVEPVEGAATGLGGIMRDVLATGARPIAFLDALFFGPPGVAADERLAQGVVEGVAHYGNALGVPTVGGEVTVDPAYAQSPLVNAMCVGLLPESHLLPSAARTAGELVVLLGSTTGRDGIAGASFASRDTSQDLGDRPQVQVGDPFRGKLLIEAVQVLVARGLLTGLGDLGAAGITSAAAEMAQRGHRGMTLDLAQVPLREMAMGPAEILLSESQERMLLVVRPQDLPQVLAVAQHFSLA